MDKAERGPDQLLNDLDSALAMESSEIRTASPKDLLFFFVGEQHRSLVVGTSNKCTPQTCTNLPRQTVIGLGFDRKTRFADIESEV
jgi:hypothetical protein